MKYYIIISLFTIFFVGCQKKQNISDNSVMIQSPQDTLHDIQQIRDSSQMNDRGDGINQQQSLVLTSNALQVVDNESGSSREISFGMPLDPMIEMVDNILHSKVVSVQVNTECGAGPLKMALWNNGLTIVFQENKMEENGNSKEWQFAGWFIGIKSDTEAITTMSGVGIGSTLAELESAYKVAVVKSSLGQEFSTSSGLYGLFDSAGKNGKITHMWSGVSCNFR